MPVESRATVEWARGYLAVSCATGRSSGSRGAHGSSDLRPAAARRTGSRTAHPAVSPLAGSGQSGDRHDPSRLRDLVLYHGLRLSAFAAVGGMDRVTAHWITRRGL